MSLSISEAKNEYTYSAAPMFACELKFMSHIGLKYTTEFYLFSTLIIFCYARPTWYQRFIFQSGKKASGDL